MAISNFAPSGVLRFDDVVGSLLAEHRGRTQSRGSLNTSTSLTISPGHAPLSATTVGRKDTLGRIATSGRGSSKRDDGRLCTLGEIEMEEHFNLY